MADESKWREVVADYRSSELTAVEFAQRRGLSVHSLRYWSHRLNAAKKSGAVRLARVVREDEARSTSEIVLERSGIRITVGSGFDRATLREVLQVLDELESR